MADGVNCGHCGGRHRSVAEVKDCFRRADGPPDVHRTETAPSGAGRPSSDGAVDGRPSRVEASRSGEKLSVPADRLAGPDLLGRSLLVPPGVAAPDPWAACPEIEASADAGADVVDELRSAWRDRRRLIIRWHGPPPDPWPAHDVAFERWEPDLELPGEAVGFFATANTVRIDDNDGCRFEPLSMAVDRGARLLSNGDAAAADADCALPDGTAVLVDGGPLDLELATETSLVPRVNLVAGSLRPMRPEAVCKADLAPDQLEAVTHRRGPARILAPAGSGKTRVLSERARHLVDGTGIAPRSVTLVAYNRRAREEMQDRLSDVGGLDIRTLNSLALALANGTGPFSAAVAAERAADPGASGGSRRTIDELEARRLLSDLVPGRRRKRLNDPLEPWIDALSACRLGLRDPHEVEVAYGGDVTGFAEVFDRYRTVLHDRGSLDFDEQILAAIDRLLRSPEARRVARSLAPVILIDEFQDLTPAHLLLIRLLSGPAAEVYAVGDDDQTIYGYAGASPRWLVDFDHFFPRPDSHQLTVNYRCPAAVVEGATNLLSHNQHRVTKTIRPAPGAESQPDALVITSGDPQAALVDRARNLIDGGAEPGEVAVLSRVHAALLPAAVYLAEAGLPVRRSLGLDRRVLERSGVAAALSWLRLATAPERSLSPDDLRNALRRPPRSLHPRVADWACEQRSVADLVALSGRLNTERESTVVAEFAADLQRVRDAALSKTTQSVLELVCHDIGLLGAASQLDQSQRSARRAAHADELAALLAVAGLHDDPATFESWLVGVLESIPVDRVGGSAAAGADSGAEPGADGGGTITLATVHTTKGLEWPHVIVHDVRDDLFPHRLADDIEEERRVFHVAVTRGRESVTVTTSGPPSRFVPELSQARPAGQPWPGAPRAGGGTATVSSRSAPSLAGKAASRPERIEPADAEEARLRDTLTEWRRERSKADEVPAYVVLDNKTLDAIAAARPDNLAALGRIKGIGPAKLERYGADILGLVAGD